MAKKTELSLSIKKRQPAMWYPMCPPLSCNPIKPVVFYIKIPYHDLRYGIF